MASADPMQNAESGDYDEVMHAIRSFDPAKVDVLQLISRSLNVSPEPAAFLNLIFGNDIASLNVPVTQNTIRYAIAGWMYVQQVLGKEHVSFTNLEAPQQYAFLNGLAEIGLAIEHEGRRRITSLQSSTDEPASDNTMLIVGLVAAAAVALIVMMDN